MQRIEPRPATPPAAAAVPYCDGAHAKHNADTGDNVGPLIVDNDAQK
jgi:hypothetical protein